MPSCYVVGCYNTDKRGYRLFAVPSVIKNPYSRNQWLVNAGLREEDVSPRAVFCEGHFELNCFEAANLQGWLLLKRNAVPTIFGENLPKTVSLVCGPKKRLYTTPLRDQSLEELVLEQPEPVQPEPMPMSPLLESHAQFTIPDGELSPISKRRRAVSICEENIPEVERLRAALNDMTSKCNKYRRLALQSKTQAVNLSKNLNKFLNEDQVALLQLEDPSKNTKEWSNSTVKTALQIRLMVGSKGYEYLRKQLGFPLPSFRTLCRRLEALQFIPGKTDEIVELLPDKVIDPNDPASKLCVMSFDEMKHEEGVSYDKGLKRCIGLVTPCMALNEEEEDMPATHTFVVVLKGLTGHWKQIISYAFTTQHVKAEMTWQYLKNTISAVHRVGLKVCLLTSDMSGQDTAVGNLLDVYSTRDGVKVTFPHPVAGEEDLIWTADVPHVFKNLWLQLTRDDMEVPRDVQQNFDLPSNIVVSAKHVAELLEHQNGGGAKLVPKLSKNHLNPSQFEKMRVGMASTFFSETLGLALIFLAEKGIISEEAKTTGWFFLQVAKWFKLMVNRQIFDALGTDVHSEDRLRFLSDFMDFMNGVSFKNNRKPVQNGIALTTTAMLKVHSKYVQNGPLKYVLTARGTTTSVENTFSQVRDGVENPTAARVRLMLRLISVGQFLHVSKYSSYEPDYDEHAVDFLKSASRQKAVTTEEEDLRAVLEQANNDIISVDLSDVNLTFVEECGLYYMSGWAATKANITCEACKKAVKSRNPLEIAEAGWTDLLSKGGLSHPTAVVYHVHYILEKIFQTLRFLK